MGTDLPECLGAESDLVGTTGSATLDDDRLDRSFCLMQEQTVELGAADGQGPSRLR
jgi:hypothetical protein